MAGLAQGKSTGRYNSVFLTVFFLSVPLGNVFAGVLFIIQGTTNSAPPMADTPTLAPSTSAGVVMPPLLLLLALLVLVIMGGIMFVFIRLPDSYPNHPNSH